MSTVVDTVSKCGVVHTNDFAPLFPSLPVSTLSPLSSRVYSTVIDDDEEDSVHCPQSSPISMQTLPKESPSPGSSEFPSVLSDKCSSKGYSGDSFYGNYFTAEITDNERSISECSLSPSQRLGTCHTTTSPLPNRLDDSLYSTGTSVSFHERSSQADSFVLSSDRQLSPLDDLCTTTILQTSTDSLAFTPLYSSAYSVPSIPPRDRIYNACSLTNSHEYMHDNKQIVMSLTRSLVSAETGVPQFGEVSPRSKHSPTFRYPNDDYSVSKLPLSARHVHLCNDPTSSSTFTHDNNPTVYSHATVTVSACNSLRTGDVCPEKSLFHSCFQVLLNSQHSPFCRPSCTQDECNAANICSPPIWSTATSHPSALGCDSPGTSNVTRNQSKEQNSAIFKSVIPRKRRSQLPVSSRVTKRRRIIDRDGIMGPTSTLPFRFNSNESRFRLQEPVVSLPITVCPPTPVPSKFRGKDSFFLPSDCSLLLDPHSPGPKTGKYSTFPLCLNATSHLPSNELHLLYRITNHSDQRTADALLHENFLVNALKQAGIRSSHCYFYRSPCSPSTSAELLSSNFMSDVDKDCTTPPLNKSHEYDNTVIDTNKDVCSGLFVSSVNCRFPETVVQSGTWSMHKPIACSYCAMQIMDPESSVECSVADLDGKLVFCSSFCLSAYRTTGTLSSRSAFDTVSRFPAFCEVTLSSTTNPVFVLIQPPLTKFGKVVPRRFSNLDKFNRRRRSEFFVSLKSCKFQRCVPWRWNPYRWRHFSKFVFRDCSLRSCEKISSEQITYQTSATRHRSLQLTLLDPNRFDMRAPNFSSRDSRVCLLCHSSGDAPDDISGRLLPYNYKQWLHLNCILWCYDTYETVSGGIVGVPRALKKASETFCSYCHRTGAGLPCFYSDCSDVYHLPCAYFIRCSFHADRSMYCPFHSVETDSFSQLKSLAAHRRVYICRDESTQVENAILLVGQESQTHTGKIRDTSAKLRVGGLILHSVGQLLPEQLSSGYFHSSQFIYPVGYSSTRIYWSYRHVSQRCRYHCRIVDGPFSMDSRHNVNAHQTGCAKFVVCVEETDEPMEVFQNSTCNGVWQQIINRINMARRSHGIGRLRIVQQHITGETLYGLNEPHIIRAIESLPGVERLNNYVFKFGRLQLIKEMPLVLNPTGCARSEPKLRTHIRQRSAGETADVQHSLFVRNAIITHHHHMCTPARSSLGSPVYLSSIFSGVSKSQQYRRLRTEWRANVVLGRSRIQGLGLYAARDLGKHMYIIEYLGELIRNEVGNKRERLYESQNRGVYMFRVDDDNIVDATMCGGLARYINHSCDPNCTAEVLTCDGGSHIIILANRDIEKGEELTYDYKFDVEEDQGDRIPCLCGSLVCRKWMN